MARINRMSSLPVAERCGAAGELLQTTGSGRSAVMSSAFHAVASGSPEADEKLMLLTADERAEIARWSAPVDVTIEGATLRYQDADKELLVAIDEYGDFCEPCPTCLGQGSISSTPCSECDATGARDGGPCPITVGHLDFAWCVREHDSVYVGDIKRSHFTTAEGPLSLQLLAYGTAYAAKMRCTKLHTAIWSATEHSYDWSHAIDLSSWSGEREEILRRIRFASKNRGKASPGPHCSECYASGHCPEHLLPGADLAAASDGALEPYTEPGGITPETAPALLHRYIAAKELLAKAKSALELYADQHGGIACEDKVWRRVVSRSGCERLNTKRLKQDHPELVASYVEQSGPRNMGYRFTNKRTG